MLKRAYSRGGNNTQRNVVFCGAHRFVMANTHTFMVWQIFMANTQTFMVYTDFYGEQFDLKNAQIFLWFNTDFLWLTFFMTASQRKFLINIKHTIFNALTN